MRPPPGRLRLTSRARLLGRLLFGVASALVLASAGIGWYLHAAALGGLASSNALSGLGGSGRPGGDLNVLLMGLDSRRDNQGNDLPPATLEQLHAGSSSDVGGYNTNTLILLHVPADRSRAVALSIPRDDYIDLPEGLGRHKIKEAYGRAKAAAEASVPAGGPTDHATLERLGREAGRHAAIDAVQQFLGVRVDHFAEVNLVGFYDLADALGGVQVCLRAPVHDWYSGADFPAGVQTLNGAQSLAFVRQRHGLPNGDLDRTRRQQAFLAAATHQLRAAGVFSDLAKVRALLDVARKDLVVDSGFDLLAFAKQAGAVTSGNVSFYTLPIQGFATVDGESVNLIDPAQVRRVTQRLLSGQDADGQTPTATDLTGPALAGVTDSASSPDPTAPAAHSVRWGARRANRANHVTATPLTATPFAAAAAPSALAPIPSGPPGVPCVN
jgi:LCP family protein required for cell wall assembly